MSWRSIIVFTAAGLGLWQNAHAQTPCRADRDTPSIDRRIHPTATFDAVERRAPSNTSQPALHHFTIESVTLENGVKVHVTATGCEVRRVEYLFVLSDESHSVLDNAYWFQRAASLIEEIARANLDEWVPLGPIAEELKVRAGKAGKPGSIPIVLATDPLPSGPPGNKLIVSNTKEFDGTELTVAYEFPVEEKP